MNNNKLLVKIIIVNYRTPELTFYCLESLSKQWKQFPYFNTIVVDNNSGDNSVLYFKKKIKAHGWSDWISIFPLSVNKGFSGGNNAAIEQIISSDDCTEYIMLLNPDTIVKPKAVPNLIQFLKIHKDAGIVGAQLQNGLGRLESTAKRYPSIISEMINGARLNVLSKICNRWQVNLPIQKNVCRCGWVSGAAMMIRRKVFEQIGFLDEGYFLYFEELDFCRRASLCGWQIWLEPLSVVTHFEGKATEITNERKRRGKYWFDSRRRYFVKHYGVFSLIAADLLWTLGRFSWFLRKIRKLKKAVSSDPLYFTRDLLMGDIIALLDGNILRIKKQKNIFEINSLKRIKIRKHYRNPKNYD